LGIRSHFRFKRIIAMSQRNNNATNKTIVSRLAYFKDMNTLVSIILFSYSVSFIVLCSDGLTEAKVINSSKFATDTIVANVNICTVFLCLCLVSDNN
jgi:serine/threonine protein phosphatase PrpC